MTTIGEVLFKQLRDANKQLHALAARDSLCRWPDFPALADSESMKQALGLASTSTPFDIMIDLVTSKFIVQNAPDAALKIVLTSIRLGKEIDAALSLIQAGLPKVCHKEELNRGPKGLPCALLSLEKEQIPSVQQVLKAWLDELNPKQVLAFFKTNMVSTESRSMDSPLGIELAKLHHEGNEAASMAYQMMRERGVPLIHLGIKNDNAIKLVIQRIRPLCEVAKDILREGHEPTLSEVKLLFSKDDNPGNREILRAFVDIGGIKAQTLRDAGIGKSYSRSLSCWPDLPDFVASVAAAEAVNASSTPGLKVTPL